MSKDRHPSWCNLVASGISLCSRRRNCGLLGTQGGHDGQCLGQSGCSHLLGSGFVWSSPAMSESRIPCQHYNLRVPRDPSPHDHGLTSHPSLPANRSMSGRPELANGRTRKARGHSSIKQVARFLSAFEVPRSTRECTRNPPPHLTGEQHLQQTSDNGSCAAELGYTGRYV